MGEGTLSNVAHSAGCACGSCCEEDTRQPEFTACPTLSRGRERERFAKHTYRLQGVHVGHTVVSWKGWTVKLRGDEGGAGSDGGVTIWVAMQPPAAAPDLDLVKRHLC